MKQVTVTLTLPDGKRKYYRGATRREAEAKRLADQILIAQGVVIDDNSRVSDVAELWYRLNVGDRDLHTKSKEAVRGTLDRYILPAIGDLRVKDVKPVAIRELMNGLSDMSRSTQSKVLSALKGIFSCAVENGMIIRSPVSSDIKAEGKAPDEVEALTDDQCSRLLDAVRGTRAALFVHVLLYGGLRKGEALGLMWSDVDLASGILRIRRSIVYPAGNKAGEINTDLKTKTAQRDVPICPELHAALAAADHKGLYVFSMPDGRYLSESSFNSLWGIVDRRTADPDVRDIYHQRTLDFTVHPHQLRHTCITRWVERGLSVEEVQYIAGHADPQTTLKYYTHYRKQQRLSETAQKMGAAEIS